MKDAHRNIKHNTKVHEKAKAVDDGTIPTCELSDKASSAQEHQVDLHIADQTLRGVHQLVQSLQSHLLLSWLVHRKRCSAD
jgi:hypothetical protein